MTLSIKKLVTDTERHSRKCVICNHAKREQIERDYVEWHPIAEIAEEYEVLLRAIHRHANALNLDQEKRDNKLWFYQRIMDRAPNKVSVADALAAAKLMAQEQGKLIDNVHHQHKGLSEEDRDQLLRKVLEVVDGKKKVKSDSP